MKTRLVAIAMIVATTSTALFAAVASGHAAQPRAAKASMKTTLYSLAGTDFKVTRVAGRYRVSLPAATAGSWFTDRPYRSAGRTTATDIVMQWAASGFDKVPPNAALVITKSGVTRQTIVELTQPTIDGNRVGFTAKALMQGSAMGMKTTNALHVGRYRSGELFIDNGLQQCPADIGGGQVANGTFYDSNGSRSTRPAYLDGSVTGSLICTLSTNASTNIAPPEWTNYFTAVCSLNASLTFSPLTTQTSDTTYDYVTWHRSNRGAYFDRSASGTSSARACWYSATGGKPVLGTNDGASGSGQYNWDYTTYVFDGRPHNGMHYNLGNIANSDAWDLTTVTITASHAPLVVQVTRSPNSSY